MAKLKKIILPAAVLAFVMIPGAARADFAVEKLTLSIGGGGGQWVRAQPSLNPFSLLYAQTAAYWTVEIQAEATATAPCGAWSFVFSTFTYGAAAALGQPPPETPGITSTNRAHTEVDVRYNDADPNVAKAGVEVIAQCSAGAAVSKRTETIYIDQPPLASNASVPGHLFNQNAKDTVRIGAVAGLGATTLIVAIAITGPVGLVTAAGALTWLGQGAVWTLVPGLIAGALAIGDPPDYNYDSIAPIVNVRPPQAAMRCPKAVPRPRCRSVQQTYRELVGADAALLSVLDAEAITNNRFMTAAHAQDADAQLLQHGVGSLYAARLGSALDIEEAARKRFANALRRAGMTYRISAKAARQTEHKVLSLNLPPQVRDPIARLLAPAGGMIMARQVLAALRPQLHYRPHTTTLADALDQHVPTSAVKSAASTVGPTEAAEIDEALIRQGNVTGNLLAARAAFINWRLSCDPTDRVMYLRQAADAANTSSGPNADLLRSAANAAVANPSAGLGPGC